jgi:hypothetical protein
MAGEPAQKSATNGIASFSPFGGATKRVVLAQSAPVCRPNAFQKISTTNRMMLTSIATAPGCTTCGHDAFGA